MIVGTLQLAENLVSTSASTSRNPAPAMPRRSHTCMVDSPLASTIATSAYVYRVRDLVHNIVYQSYELVRAETGILNTKPI